MMTPGYYERKKAEGYYVRPCPLCGGPMSRYSKRCARHYRDGSLIEPVTADCPNGGFNGGGCDTRGTHKHCDCGEPILPDADGRYTPTCVHCVQWSERMARKRMAVAS